MYIVLLSIVVPQIQSCQRYKWTRVFEGKNDNFWLLKESEACKGKKALSKRLNKQDFRIEWGTNEKIMAQLELLEGVETAHFIFIFTLATWQLIYPMMNDTKFSLFCLWVVTVSHHISHHKLKQNVDLFQTWNEGKNSIFPMMNCRHGIWVSFGIQEYVSFV